MKLKQNTLLLSLLILAFTACTSDKEAEETEKKEPFANFDCKLDQVKLSTSTDTFEFDVTYNGDYTQVRVENDSLHKIKSMGNNGVTPIRFVYQPDNKLFVVYRGDNITQEHKVLLASDEARSELDRIACEYSVKSRRTVIKGENGFEFKYLKNANGLHLNTVENAPFRFSYIQDKTTLYSNILKYNPSSNVEVVKE